MTQTNNTDKQLFIPTADDIEWIKQIAVARRQQAKQLGCRDRFGLTFKNEEEAMKLEIQGCAGELAFSRMLGEPWQATVNSFRGADHVTKGGSKIQVKTVDAVYKGLIVPDDYSPGDAYVLVHLIDGDLSKGLIVRGWRKADEVEKYGVRRQSPGRDQGFRVIPPKSCAIFLQNICKINGTFWHLITSNNYN